MLKYLIVFLLLFGCVDSLVSERFVDPRLEPYVESFYREAHARGLDPHRNVAVKFGRLDNLLGVAKYRWGIHTVYIDIEEYRRYQEELYETPEIFHLGYEDLMFHELGHAVLGLEHCNCDGIMHPYASIFTYAYNPALREDMIDELFNAKRID